MSCSERIVCPDRSVTYWTRDFCATRERFAQWRSIDGKLKCGPCCCCCKNISRTKDSFTFPKLECDHVTYLQALRVVPILCRPSRVAGREIRDDRPRTHPSRTEQANRLAMLYVRVIFLFWADHRFARWRAAVATDEVDANDHRFAVTRNSSLSRESDWTLLFPDTQFTDTAYSHMMVFGVQNWICTQNLRSSRRRHLLRRGWRRRRDMKLSECISITRYERMNNCH